MISSLDWLRDAIVALFASGDAVLADMARRGAAEPVPERVSSQEEAERISLLILTL